MLSMARTLDLVRDFESAIKIIPKYHVIPNRYLMTINRIYFNNNLIKI